MLSAKWWGVASAIALMMLACLARADQQAPGWVHQPPISSDSTFAGVGTGMTAAIARRNALADITQQISTRVSSTTVSSQSKAAGDINSTFEMTVTGASVAIQFNDISVEDTYLHSATQQVSVLVHVSKASVIRHILQRLNYYASLQFPETGSESEKLLWLLRYKHELEQANAYALAYQNLTGAASAYTFKTQLAKLLQAEQTLGVRVVAGRDMSDVSALIRRQLPASGEPDLWLQLAWKKQHRSNANNVQQRISLTAQLTESQSPYRQLHSATIGVIGEGDSLATAALNATQKLNQQLTQPIAHWLFKDLNAIGHTQ
ncbi:LPP20 family lipoprotein [Alteromonas sp. ASW11-19]|uniref:LPP20 family lipoprotein n=1 Tax=Alteromonas salexigens TaxID=2982530 RepID=A0ABT2VQN3_9ALTE|nr:LPP20 family lipoprotein [Alteromonas salexigens]MCU7555384.1 LPP20 family lipoprotein [Alteromonas salexigens]